MIIQSECTEPMNLFLQEILFDLMAQSIMTSRKSFDSVEIGSIQLSVYRLLQFNLLQGQIIDIDVVNIIHVLLLLYFNSMGLMQ